MKIITTSTKSELKAHQTAIEVLFNECFGNRLSLELWRWAFLENPHGDPYVSLCYDAERLVGHYAMIPMPLTNSKAKLNSYLSMTTMVAASHRKHGLFVKLAETTYRRALVEGIDFVMGFPNEMSTPGFRKKLNWNLPESDYVATIPKEKFLDTLRSHPLNIESQYFLNLHEDSTRKWRLSRPGATYHWQNGLAYKTFGDSIDILAFDDYQQIEELPSNTRLNLLLPAKYNALYKYRKFSYQFGGLSLSSTFPPNKIARHMALSDVF